MERIYFGIAELQAFVAAAEKLNFKAAADSICISQPALSRRIDKLEAGVGAQLLERTTRYVALTEAGAVFLESARNALDELQSGLQGIGEGIARSHGQVCIACIPSLAASFLPRILKRFAVMHPHIRVRMMDEGAQQVLASVMSGVANFGLDFIGAQELDIEFTPIHTEEYCLAVHKSHPFAKRRAVDWTELEDERFIGIAKSSGNRILIDNALASLSKRPSIFHETNHVAGALGLVGQGLGVAAVPSLSLPNNSYADVVRVPLKNPSVTRVLGLISRKGKSLSPAASMLYRLLQDSSAHASM